MTMYQIQGTVQTTTLDGWEGSAPLPMFLLDGEVQGILTEARAVQVAEDLLRSVASATGRAVGEYRASQDRVSFTLHARMLVPE